MSRKQDSPGLVRLRAQGAGPREKATPGQVIARTFLKAPRVPRKTQPKVSYQAEMI